MRRLRLSGLGMRVQASGWGVEGLRFWAFGLRFDFRLRVWDLWFWAFGLRFDFRLRVWFGIYGFGLLA